MAIEGTGTNDQEVEWVDTTFSGITAQTTLIWAKSSSFVAPSTSSGRAFLFTKLNSFNIFHEYASTSALINALSFISGFDGTLGRWDSTANVVTNDTLYHFAVTYNHVSTTDDPLFYFNGASITVNESSTPAGAQQDSGAINLLDVGGFAGHSNKGPIFSLCYYNRIMAADEIKSAFDSRLAVPSYNGLIFCPQLWGITGVQDGNTLSSSNTVVDIVTGNKGTPAVNPVFNADNVLRIR